MVYVQVFGTGGCFACLVALAVCSTYAALRTQDEHDTVFRRVGIVLYLSVFVVPLVYYLWLCARERSLQCVFFTTPRWLLYSGQTSSSTSKHLQYDLTLLFELASPILPCPELKGIHTDGQREILR